MTSTVKRNTDVFFHSSFADESGKPTQPSSVTLRVSYERNKERFLYTTPMALQPAGFWFAKWFCQKVDVGDVFWAILANGTENIADEGVIRVEANPANP